MNMSEDDPLFFLDEVKMIRTASLVATSLGSLRRLEIIGRGQNVAPDILLGFAKLAREASVMRDRLVAERAPILDLVASDPVAKRLAARADTLIAQLEELVDLVARLQAGQDKAVAPETGDHQRRS
ncbi:hypothetical protein [Dongia sp.]|uniref:hypothetical protein n=1 Tax=Dongia sp. TaxID=1977262 RepID=UPI0035B04130